MRLAAIVTVGALLASSANGVHAEDPERAAQARLDRGVAAYEAHDYPRAAIEFAAAAALVPDRANPHRWLGLTRLQLGDCAGAVPELDAFLTRAAADDPRVAEVVRLREECRRTGMLAVASSPPGAAVRLDGGAVLGLTPYRGPSTPVGAHLLAVEKDGYQPATRSVIVPAADTLTVDLHLAPRASSSSRWWVWAALGVGAVIVTGAALALRHDGTSTLPPVRCDGAGMCTP
jgi:hypothetical protein